MMKDKLTTLVYLTGAALLFQRLCTRAPVRNAWKSFQALLKAGSGPVLITDLAFPLRNRKIPAT
jgi:hypothetical protein